MNYREGSGKKLFQLHYDEFISEFEAQYPDYMWTDVVVYPCTLIKALGQIMHSTQLLIDYQLMGNVCFIFFRNCVVFFVDGGLVITLLYSMCSLVFPVSPIISLFCLVSPFVHFFLASHLFQSFPVNTRFFVFSRCPELCSFPCCFNQLPLNWFFSQDFFLSSIVFCFSDHPEYMFFRTSTLCLLICFICVYFDCYNSILFGLQ